MQWAGNFRVLFDRFKLTKMEMSNWIVLESSADLRQNLQSSASDNKLGVIQHLLVWLRER